jgi:hypothetical protein
MPEREPTEPSIEKHSVEGRSVEIRKREGKEELWIDGVRRRFFVTEDGYTLHADAYAPPQKSLLQAAKVYLRKQPKPGHEH